MKRIPVKNLSQDNKLFIDILFNITRDPNTLASGQVEIDGGVLGGGGY